MSWPLVSVLMPAYNTEKYIHQAIKSILNQTYKNIEFIIFNDGSIDNTLSIIESYAAIDNRIVVVSSKTNKGYVYHLNHGISIANGKYIARMDSDDISLPKRIENQVLFMEANPKIGVCGSSAILWKEDKAIGIWTLPTQNEKLKAMLPFRVPFIHPTVMLRKNTITNNSIQYNNNLLPAEDYDFWCNLFPYTTFANLTTPLIKYRQHSNQISKAKTNIQRENSSKIQAHYFNKLFISKDYMEHYLMIGKEDYLISNDFVKQTISTFQAMEKANERISLFDKNAFNDELSFQLFKVCTHLASKKIFTLYVFLTSTYSHSNYISNKLLIKFYIKNLMRFAI